MIWTLALWESESTGDPRAAYPDHNAKMQTRSFISGLSKLKCVRDGKLFICLKRADAANCSSRLREVWLALFHLIMRVGNSLVIPLNMQRSLMASRGTECIPNSCRPLDRRRRFQTYSRGNGKTRRTLSGPTDAEHICIWDNKF